MNGSGNEWIKGKMESQSRTISAARCRKESLDLLPEQFLHEFFTRFYILLDI